MFVSEFWKKFGTIDMKWHYLNALLYAGIGIFSLIANSMVLYYIIMIKKKTNRPNGMMFLINLAIADILKVLINLPMTSISSFYGRWVFEQIGCDIYGLAGGLFGFISISTLVLMSMERYLIVRSPINIERFGFKMKLICISITWIYSAILITLQMFSKNGFVLEGMLTSCSFDYLSRDFYSRSYMLIMFIGGFIIPLLLILVFYSLTKLEVKRKNKYIFRMSSSERRRTLNSLMLFEQNGQKLNQPPLLSDFSDTSDIGRFNDWKKKILKHDLKNKENIINLQTSRNYYYLLRRETQVLKRIILNVVFFCIAWLPYAIMALTAQFAHNIDNYITPFTTSLPAILAKISSIYNPILYTLTSKECKNYYRKLFRINYK